MAEFCFRCVQRIHDPHATERDYIITEEETLCEGCGEWRRVVIAQRGADILPDFSRLFARIKHCLSK